RGKGWGWSVGGPEAGQGGEVSAGRCARAAPDCAEGGDKALLSTGPGSPYHRSRRLSPPAAPRGSGCGGVGRGGLLDHEAILASKRGDRPPAVALVVVAVLAAQPRCVELGHRHRVLPQLEKRLQRPARADLAVIVEHQANDLEHGRSSVDPGRCVTRRLLQEFDGVAAPGATRRRAN